VIYDAAVTTDVADLAEIASRYDTDKSINTHYLRTYQTLFAGLAGEDIRLLELGIHTGGSLRLWRDFFPRGLIVGVDAKLARIDGPDTRIRTYQGAQDDVALLDRIGAETAPGGFDIIIDDCSHVGAFTRASFWHLFDRHLKSGGIYAIEDWGTGYWEWWIDGAGYVAPPPRDAGRLHTLARRFHTLRDGVLVKRFPVLWTLLARIRRAALRRQHQGHEFGMVGFVKELIDEAGMGDITHPEFGAGPHRPSRFREMRISHGHVIVVKA
jgi:hypothetical protein